MNYDKIGEFISLKRKTKNLTQNDLAKRIGVTDKAVSRWERGLGCPDVSILEVLANELDVSILELLKGREIENEVIKVTEADDYIKETFKVSKDLTKKVIFDKVSKFIFIAVLIISMIFILLNINNYLSSKKSEYIYGGSVYISEKDDQINIMKNNIEIIRNNRGDLSPDEQQTLVDGYEALMDYYNNHYIYHLSNNKKYTTNDILRYYLDDLNVKVPFGIIPIIKILRDHNAYNDLIAIAGIGTIRFHEMVDRDFYDYFSYQHHEYAHLKVSNTLNEYMDYAMHPESLDDCVNRFADANVRWLRLYNALLVELMKVGEIHA